MAVSRVINSDTFKVTTPSDREVQLTRLFDAPRDLLFEAMTKPEHVRRWWGILNHQYSVPICEIDLRVGGKWKYGAKGPTGDLTVFYGEYQEIEPPSRVVFTEFFEPFPDEGSVVTSVLTEEQGKTRLTVTARYSSMAVRDMVIGTGMERGAAASYDHLEAVVQDLQKS